MSGMILIVILIVWFYIALILSSFLGAKIRAGLFKTVMRFVLFPLILLAPVADEIIGGFQFRALCKVEAVAVYDEAKVRERTVYDQSADLYYFTDTVLPTYKQTWKYADHTNNEELISFVELHSDGGWLSRWISFNSSQHPYTFDGVCGDNYRKYFFQDLNIKIVNKG
jgi:hypothetical protein